MTGRNPDYKKHCRLKFGSYVQTHEEDQPRNSQKARSLGAITLGPDSSQQAGYWFMNLNTGERIHRRSWTPLPMPEEVIKIVEQLGKSDGQPNLLTFTNEDGDNFLDDEGEGIDDDISYGSETETQDELHNSGGEITGVESEDSDNEDDLTYSDNDDNLSTVSEAPD